MHGTVVCVDESKLKGEALVKEINDSIGMTKAYFYECNLKQPNGITEIIQKVSKDVGDVTILVNCSIVNTVALYFNVSFPELKNIYFKLLLCYSFLRSLNQFCLL